MTEKNLCFFGGDEDFSDNGQEKTLCVILIDHSAATTSEIADINQALQNFHKGILENDSLYPRIEITLVSCNNDIGIIQRPSLVENFSMPTLKATNNSHLLEGIIKSIEIVKERRIHYWNQGISTKCPWIIPISNGDIGAESVKKNLKQIVEIRKRAQYYKQYFIQPIAISEKANMEVLETLATTKPLLLKDAEFSGFFRFLSVSFGGNPAPISQNATIELENPFGSLTFEL